MKTRYTEGEARAVISGFAAAFEQDEFRAELDRLTRDRWGSPLEVRFQPLKAHKNRCTFDIAVQTVSGWHGLIGKVHTADRSDVFRTMDAIRQAGFGQEAEFSIPRPLAYLPSLHVLLEEKVPGPAARDVFLSGSLPEQLAAAERCGQWLTRFHAAAPRLGTAADLAKELDRFRRWADKIVSFGEPLARKANALLRRLEAAAPDSAAGGHRPGHGSYMPEHVMLAEGRTAVIDLDECDVADPARDVAWFIVSLQRLGLKHLYSLHALDRPAQHFLATYFRASPGGATAHVPFYCAAECLHRARRDLDRRIPPDPQWAEIMLDEGLRALLPGTRSITDSGLITADEKNHQS
jgi:aminoglycoside phosphotransferase (APT) family kinase protein